MTLWRFKEWLAFVPKIMEDNNLKEEGADWWWFISHISILMTKGARITEKEEPCEARFLDKFGNLCVRYITRPQVISLYFKYSNVVDVHSQSRQADLSLEKKWAAEDWYFRIYTTILGMILTYTWKLFWGGHFRSFCKATIIEFSDILAKEMIV